MKNIKKKTVYYTSYQRIKKYFKVKFINQFLKFFFTFLSAKYYQENIERLQKKLVRDIKIFLKKKRQKRSNMVVNVTKIYQKMKNRKKYYGMRKMPDYN